MLIIINHRIGNEAKTKLLASCRKNHSSVVLLELDSGKIGSPPESSFPALFLCPVPGRLIVASDLPQRVLTILKDHEVNFITGKHPAGEYFEAVAAGEYLIHKLQLTDPVILENCHYLKKIPVKQGFTRSHLLPLRDDHFITSDKGIGEVLHQRGLDVLYFPPENIQLPGHGNGGIGGASGIMGDTVYFNGTLQHHPEGIVIRNYIQSLGYTIIELSDGPLSDCGSFLFFPVKPAVLPG